MARLILLLLLLLHVHHLDRLLPKKCEAGRRQQESIAKLFLGGAPLFPDPLESLGHLARSEARQEMTTKNSGKNKKDEKEDF